MGLKGLKEAQCDWGGKDKGVVVERAQILCLGLGNQELVIFITLQVDESPDFEIHITMCDDDPPTPEEDSETQPDEDEEEEEEEKVSAPEVGAAIKIIRQLMEKFNLDLSTVTQAFLKNSGELEATSSFLESGQRADGYPIWSRQDDLDLQKDDEDARDALVKKFGAQNVARRIEFRKK